MTCRTNLRWERGRNEETFRRDHHVIVTWDEPGSPGHSYTSMSKAEPWTDVEVARLVGAIRAVGFPGLSEAAARGEAEPTGDSPAHHVAMAISTAAFAVAETLQRRRLARTLGRTPR